MPIVGQGVEGMDRLVFEVYTEVKHRWVNFP